MNKRLVRIGAGLAASTAGIAGLSIVGATPAQASTSCTFTLGNPTWTAVCTGTTYSSSVRIFWRCDSSINPGSSRYVDYYVGKGAKTFNYGHTCGRIPDRIWYVQTAP